jgi:hypothetical protein
MFRGRFNHESIRASQNFNAQGLSNSSVEFDFGSCDSNHSSGAEPDSRISALVDLEMWH